MPRNVHFFLGGNDGKKSWLIFESDVNWKKLFVFVSDIFKVGQYLV